VNSEDLTANHLNDQNLAFPVRTVKERLITGTALNFLATAFNQGSTLVVNILVARILMKEGFGEYTMVQSTLLTLATLGQLATGYTAAKYVAEYRSVAPQRAGRIMGLCAIVSAAMACVATIILVLIAPWLATSVLKAPHLSVALMIGSGFVFFSAINGYQTGALSGLEAYGGLAKAGVISGIMTMTAISLGAWTGGLNGTLVGLSISAVLRCLIHGWWLRLEGKAQGIVPQYRGSLGQEKAIITRFALPAAIAGYYSMPMFWLANSFLVRQPGGYGEMALYSAANNLRLLVLFIPNVMNSVGLSILNNEKASGDTASYHRLFRSNVTYIFLVSLGAVILVGIFGRSILQLFGKDFRAGYNLLWLLLASTIFEGLSIALYQYVQSRAKIWLSFFSISVPRDAFLVVAAYYLVQSYGGAGLAIAYLGTTILGLIFHFSLVAMLYRKERKELGSYAA
jgi:O-antigen/teichoic acid export membrane protein